MAVPNVSVGADHGLVEPIGEAFVASGDARMVAEPHYDADHGRAVYTLAGEPGALSGALRSAVVVHSARHEHEAVRVQIDPLHIG